MRAPRRRPRFPRGGRRRRAALHALALACRLSHASIAGAGTIGTHEMASAALGRPLRAAIYLPDAYADSTLRFPVVYLLHGYGGDERDYEIHGDIGRTTDSLIARGAIPPCVLVMPAAGNGWYIDGAEPIETALTGELVDWVERRWRVIPRRGGRAVAGLSMGAFGAMRYALGHPERYAAAALLSPAVYEPEPPKKSAAYHGGVFGKPFDPALWKAHNYPALLQRDAVRRSPVPMYVFSGDDDELGAGGEAMKFYTRLRELGLPAELRIADGAHHWSVWKPALAGALVYMLGITDPPERAGGNR
jgi:S-formylglutathione hydrolase FrmB